jgi:predicted nucleic acid-binding protein
VPGVGEPTVLADTSALARIPHSEAVRQALAQPLTLGVVAVCRITWLEMGITARNADKHSHLGRLLATLPSVDVGPEDFDRAWQGQQILAGQGQHRGVALPDLLVAACAERHGLQVVHGDADFDVIGEVTGQTMSWVVERGLL